jgi:glycosyltransferase involved in cell wall biosynthesis
MECVAHDGGDRAKCTVISPMFAPSPAYAKVEQRFDQEPFTVVFLGTLCIRKGTHDLIEAVAMAARERPVRLLMAGAKSLNGAMLARFSHCAEYRGFVPHAELPRFFAEGNVLALPSYSEGFPMVLVEAMAAGLPVIRSKNSGNAARHDREGFVIDAGDREAIAEAILTLARDRERLRSMSAAARLRARDYSLESCAAEWETMLMNGSR